ncbi:TIGR00730 family Rossman fold protein [Flavobacteriales bacterium]|nr:TIGR00730 family Rossman fold protein [Flavobacteriales bacterium]
MSKKVCIFCGARTGNSQEIIDKTKELVALLADQDYDLVYGGGNGGLMGLIADEFLSHGRKVIGIRPSILLSEENSHDGITEMISTEDMFERKKNMVNVSDSFIALPGGVGTLDEILDVMTLNKINAIDKPMVLFDIDGFYTKLTELLDTFVEFGYLDKEAKGLLIMEDKASGIIEALKNYN